jgi:hypothetical protein
VARRLVGRTAQRRPDRIGPAPARRAARRVILLLSTDQDRADGDVDLDGFTLGSSEAVLLLLV